MSEKAHSLLGASSAHRWLNCPGSALLTAHMPDHPTPYAEEGTQAHAVCEYFARKCLLGMNYSLTTDSNTATPIDIPADMADCAQEYLVAIREAIEVLGLPEGDAPYIALEQRVDYSRWVPDGFGTADCLLIGRGTLYVIDYKHGKGVRVEAENNPQLMLYALGAWDRYRALYSIRTVRWSIVQPRNGGTSHAPEMPIEKLLLWAEKEVKPKAVQAMAQDAPIVPGEWCRFCKARATCRARSDQQLALESFDKQDPRLLTPAEIGDALTRGAELSRWLNDLQEYALNQTLTGHEIPGWKAVAGRSVRAWTDPEAAFRKALELGVPEALLYERKPVSLAALEKTMGKKQFAQLSEYVTTPPGKPALAPDIDKRPAIASTPTAEDDFAQ